jgi:uncharacterized membrane protein YtjA (UPF0391 family)
MFNLAFAFLVIAVVTGLLGFTGITAGTIEVAKILFFVFLLLFVASLVVGFKRRSRR